MNFVRRRRNPANTAGGGCVQHAHPLVMVTDAVDAAAAAQAPKTGSSSTAQLSIQEESMRLQPTTPWSSVSTSTPLRPRLYARYYKVASTQLNSAGLTVWTFKIRVPHTTILSKLQTLGGSEPLCHHDGVAVSGMVDTTT